MPWGKLLAIAIIVTVGIGQWNSLIGILGITSNVIFEILVINFPELEAKKYWVVLGLAILIIGVFYYLLIKGNQNDQYLSIETKNGEIFGSINSSSTFLSSQSDIIKYFSEICSAHKNENSNAIFIFDGNCTREFLDYVKEEAREKIFTKYFIPANFSKLAEFKNDVIYFRGFNLFINLKEANILIDSKKLSNKKMIVLNTINDFLLGYSTIIL